MVENHDNKYKESNEEIIERLEEMKQNQVIVSQAVFAQLDEIRKLSVKDDQQLEEADLGSFMSGDKVVEEIKGPRNISLEIINQAAKQKENSGKGNHWPLTFVVKCTKIIDTSGIELANLKGILSDDNMSMYFIEWVSSQYQGPRIEEGKSYRISHSVTDIYAHDGIREYSLVFNRGTIIEEVEVNQ